MPGGAGGAFSARRRCGVAREHVVREARLAASHFERDADVVVQHAGRHDGRATRDRHADEQRAGHVEVVEHGFSGRAHAHHQRRLPIGGDAEARDAAAALGASRNDRRAAQHGRYRRLRGRAHDRLARRTGDQVDAIFHDDLFSIFTRAHDDGVTGTRGGHGQADRLIRRDGRRGRRSGRADEQRAGASEGADGTTGITCRACNMRHRPRARRRRGGPR